LLATWPLLPHIGTHLAALPDERGQDVWQQAWNIWWVREALLARHTNPYETTMLFYPQGASLVMHSLNFPLGVMGLPLLPVLGMVATYNLLTLLVVVLAGYSTFLLARHIVGRSGFNAGASAAALVAGAVVICSPQRLIELRGAQLATLSDYGVPLALLATLITLERHRWRFVVLASLLMLITGLSKWYHLFHVLLVLGPLLAWRVGAAWRGGGGAAAWRELLPWARIGGVSLLLLLPFVVPAALETLTSPFARKSDELVFSADLMLLLPLPFTSGAIWQPVPPDWWNLHMFAWVTLLLALAGGVLVPRQAGTWAALAGFCLLLSLGPSLIVGGNDTGIPLPYALFRALPVVDTFRAPARINGVTTMLVGVVAAFGVARFSRGLAAPARWSVAGVLVLLIAAETIRLPFPLVDGQVSPFYQRIADEPGEWSVLEMPLNRFERDRLEMYTQTYHRHYILTGLVSRSVPRLPQEAIPPFARIEAAAAASTTDIVALSPSEREQLLRAMRVRYLVARPDPSVPGRAARQVEIARALFGALTEVYSDTELRAYRLEGAAGWLDGPGRLERAEMPLFLGLDAQWEPLEPDGERMTRWLPPGGAGLWSYANHPRRAALVLWLYSLPEGTRPLELWLNGHHAQTLPIPGGRMVRRYVSAPLDLLAGPNHIELRAPRGGVVVPGSGDKRLLSCSIHRLELWEME
jgi:hypothetical protein